MFGRRSSNDTDNDAGSTTAGATGSTTGSGATGRGATGGGAGGGRTAAEVLAEAERAAGKGRPTPRRRDAQAARKQRMTPPRTRKEAAAVNRRKRAELMAVRQEAMRTGDERYLPTRDQGPVRRFCRDLVDARWNAAEFLLPVLLLILVLSMIPQAYALATLIWLIAIVAPLIDSVVLARKLRAALAASFPGERTRGAVPYALLRSAQLRRFRMPKPQVTRGATVQARRR